MAYPVNAHPNIEFHAKTKSLRGIRAGLSYWPVGKIVKTGHLVFLSELPA